MMANRHEAGFITISIKVNVEWREMNSLLIEFVSNWGFLNYLCCMRSFRQEPQGWPLIN